MKRGKTSTTTRSRVCAGRSLPEELIYNIFSTLPVKALMRFKFACKSWQAIVSDSRFIAAHLQREKECPCVLTIPIYGSGTFSYRMELKDKPASCEPEILDIPGLEAIAYSHAVPSHCDGLLLFDCVQKMHICNPATRELVTLPSGSPSKKPCHDLLSDQTAVLGYDPSSKKYKIVRFFYRCFDYDTHTCSIGLQVLTLGRRCRWVDVQDPPYPIVSFKQVHVHGVIYWYIDNYLHNSTPRVILSFNLRDHEFALVPPPPIFSIEPPFYLRSSLKDLDGNLGCLTYRNSALDVYVYRNDNCKEGQRAWHVLYTLNLSTLKQQVLGPVVFYKNGKLLACFENCFQCYDLQAQTKESVTGGMNKWPVFSDKLIAAKFRDWSIPWMHHTHYIQSMVRII